MPRALLVSSRAMCPPKDVIVIGIRCENTKQPSSSKRRPAKDIIIDFGGGGKKKSGGQNVDVVVERGGGGGGGGGGGEKNVLTQGRRRSTFITVAYASYCAFLAQGGFLPNNAKAAGGWGDCAPVCDALKDGFSAQQKMQEEMLRQSLATMNKSSDESGFGDDGSEKEGAKKKSDKVDFAQKSEREKRKKNSTTRRQ